MQAAILQMVVTGVLLGLLYALASVGLNLIWGIIGIINFSQAEYLMLGMFTAYWLYQLLGLDPLLSLPVAFFVTFLLGAVVQRFAINRVLNAPALTQVAVTFALLLIIRYTALMLWGPDSRSTITWYSEKSLSVGSVLISYPMLISSILAALSTLLLFLFLTRTDTGIALRATAQDRATAQLYGIEAVKMYTLAFAIAVGITGLTGALFSTIYWIMPEVGAIFSVLMYTVVVLGGLRSLLGCFVGGIIVGLVECLSAFYITPSMKDVPVFLLLLIILVIKPSGLFARKGAL